MSVSKRKNEGYEEFIPNNKFDATKLNVSQREIFDLVKNHAENASQGLEQEPLKILIQGGAGTGKSYLIGCIRNELQNLLKIGAFTASAAVNV